MTSVFVFLLIIAAIVVIGGWWMLRSAASSPADDDGDPDEPVAVRGPAPHMEIEVARSKLEAAGIQAYTRSRDGPIMPGGVAPQLFGWEVLVRRRDADEALAILKDEPDE